MVVSLSALFTSIVTFWQNCVISIDFPKIEIPDWLQKFIFTIKNFLTYLTSLIGNIPQFDLRFELILVSNALPLILNIFTVPFIKTKFQTFIHYIDLIVFILFGYGLGGLLNLSKNIPSTSMSQKESSILVLATLSYFAIRGLISIILICRTKPKVSLVADDLTNFYLDGIVPSFESQYTLEEINAKLKESSTARLVKNKSKWYVIVLFLLFGTIFAALSVAFLGVHETFKIDLPNILIKNILVSLFIPISLLLFTLGIMKATQCGVNLLLKIGHFFKRWGLKLLLFAIDSLYVPILESLLDNLIPIKYSCPAGTEGYSQTVDIELYKRNFTCRILTTTHPSTVKSEWRMYNDHALTWFDNVLNVNVMTILSTIIFILIGVPFLWGKLIHSNRKFVLLFNVYGRGVEKKWRTLMTKLETSGVFLFQKYRIEYPYWIVIMIFAKFILLFINTLSKQISGKFTILQAVYYLIMTIVIIIIRPYIYNANNLFDAILFGLNFIYALFPVLAEFDVVVPKSVIDYVSYAILAVPIICTVLFFFFGKPDENDPTLITDKIQEVINEAEEIKKEKMEEEKKEVDIFDLEIEGLHEEVSIKEGILDSLDNVLNGKTIEGFTTLRIPLAQAFTKLYQMVDIIIDSQTIDMLGNYLNTVANFSAIAIGFVARKNIDAIFNAGIDVVSGNVKTYSSTAFIKQKGYF